MARIRSTHPGQWTDEAFVSCSPLARLLAIALRNEADDQGVFEWKPLMLKMRLLPADDCNVAELLAELESTGQVRRYEVDGRSYGLIRNFTKYQRPKKPNAIHPLPEQVPDQSPTEPEISPQMEDVGGRRKEESAPNGARRCAPVAPVRLADLEGPPDKLLFSEGLAYLARTYGKPPNAFRPVVGKWLQACRNNHEAVWSALCDIDTRGLADPVSKMFERFPDRGKKTGLMQAIDHLEREYVG